MSRGLPPQEAQRLLVEGFFDPVFQRIPLAEVREQLSNEVTSRLDEGRG
jgi:Fe-S cluster assembly protein SufD